MFYFKSLNLENYRCFTKLDLVFEPDLTILFAENGSGKSAILNALGLGLGVFQPSIPRGLRLNHRDIKLITLDDRGRREPAGDCKVVWGADIGERSDVEWSTTIKAATGRISRTHNEAMESIEGARKPGERWPLFAWYGTNRMDRCKVSTKPAPCRPDRWEGYAGSLNPDQDESALLTWLLEEILADTVRRQEGEEERFLATAVMDVLTVATPGIARAWYDPRERSPMVRFKRGEVASWTELSDGFHIFLALIADIARRAVMLNEIDGGDAVTKVEGVVLIDEIDLHLHPRWQRVVLDGLRATFPRLQFVVTTHSPQVLSSALNRQVRRLFDGQLQEHGVFVEGRDTNAILREYMSTDDRGKTGRDELRALHDAIDQGRREEAEAIIAQLVERWGNLDPVLIRARGFLDDMED